MRLAETLTGIRIDRSLTQEAAGRICNLHRSVISRWETGDQDITVLEFCDYVSGLGYDPLIIIAEARKPAPDPDYSYPLVAHEASPCLTALLKERHDYEPGAKRKVDRMMRLLEKKPVTRMTVDELCRRKAL